MEEKQVEVQDVQDLQIEDGAKATPEEKAMINDDMAMLDKQRSETIPEKLLIKPLTIDEAKKRTYYVKIQRDTVGRLLEALKHLANTLADSQPGARWSHFVTKNAQKLHSIEVDTSKMIRVMYPAPDSNPRIKEYGDKEFKLITENSEKDELGNPVLNQKTNQFKIEDAKKEQYEVAMKALRTEYDDVMKIYEEVEMKSQVIRKEVIHFVPNLILQSNLPSGILPAYYELIDPFVIED